MGNLFWGAEVRAARTAPPSEVSLGMGVGRWEAVTGPIDWNRRSWKWGRVTDKRAFSAGRGGEGLRPGLPEVQSGELGLVCDD